MSDQTDFLNNSDEGISGFIKRSYDKAVSRISWATYDGLWKATTTGIGKGILLTIGAIVAVHLIGGAFAGHAGELAYGGNMVKGMATGIGYGLKYAFTSGLPIVAVGAAIGAVSDIRTQSQEASAQMVAAREMMKKHERGISKSPNVIPEQSQPYQHEEVNPYRPQTGWASMRKDVERDEGRGR